MRAPPLNDSAPPPNPPVMPPTTTNVSHRLRPRLTTPLGDRKKVLLPDTLSASLGQVTSKHRFSASTAPVQAVGALHILQDKGHDANPALAGLINDGVVAPDDADLAKELIATAPSNKYLEKVLTTVAQLEGDAPSVALAGNLSELDFGPYTCVLSAYLNIRPSGSDTQVDNFFTSSVHDAPRAVRTALGSLDTPMPQPEFAARDPISETPLHGALRGDDLATMLDEMGLHDTPNHHGASAPSDLSSPSEARKAAVSQSLALSQHPFPNPPATEESSTTGVSASDRTPPTRPSRAKASVKQTAAAAAHHDPTTPEARSRPDGALAPQNSRLPTLTGKSDYEVHSFQYCFPFLDTLATTVLSLAVRETLHVLPQEKGYRFGKHPDDEERHILGAARRDSPAQEGC
ncbi:hypothetical protein PMIN02_009218 [Paraphaeosphaeria minitans]